MSDKLKEKIRSMSVEEIIDALQAENQDSTILAICENDSGYYAIEDWFQKLTMSQIICKGAFKGFSEADFIEGSYLCIWAQKECSRISEAEAKICRTEDEVKAYVIQLIDEDVLDDFFEDDDEEEDEE